MKTRRRRALLLNAMCAASTAVSTPAVLAQTESATEPAVERLEEVIVTALKNNVSQFDTPATVDVASAEELRERGITSVIDIGSVVSGVSIINDPVAPSARMRGLGTNGFALSYDTSVGTFVDGIFQPRGRDLLASLFDLENIQVVKGTQAAVLGINTSIGALVLSSRRPRVDGDLHANFNASYDLELESNIVEAGVDLPVGNDGAIRIAGRRQRNHGWLENHATGGDGQRAYSNDVRLSGLWNPTDDFQIYGYVQYDEIKRFGPIAWIVDDPLGVGAQYAAPYLPPGEPFVTGKEFVTLQSDESFFFDGSRDAFKTTKGVLELTWNIGENTLTSVSGYDHRNPENRNFWEVDYGPGPYGSLTSIEGTTQYSTELRFATSSAKPARYLAGIFGSHNEWHYNQNLYYLLPSLFGFSTTPCSTPDPTALCGAQFGDFDQTTKVVSLFGQAEFDFATRYTAAIGLRATRSKKEADISQRWDSFVSPGGFVYPNPPSFFFQLTYPEVAPTELSRSETLIDANVSLRYAISDAWRVYAAAGQGSKSGGFANNLYQVQSLEYPKEVAKQVEVGTKFQSEQLNANLSIYYIKVKDFQNQYLDAVQFVLESVPLKSRGADLDLVYSPIDTVDIAANVSYSDPTDQSRQGVHLIAGTSSPRWTGNADARFTLPVAEYDLSLGLGFEFKAGFWDIPALPAQPAGGGHGPRSATQAIPGLPSWIKYNASLGLAKDNWSVSLIGRNLTNKFTLAQSPISGFLLGETFNRIDPSRTVLLQASYEF